MPLDAKTAAGRLLNEPSASWQARSARRPSSAKLAGSSVEELSLIDPYSARSMDRSTDRSNVLSIVCCAGEGGIGAQAGAARSISAGPPPNAFLSDRAIERPRFGAADAGDAIASL